MDHVLFASLDDLPLNIRQRSVVEKVGKWMSFLDTGPDLRGEFFNCIEDGLSELIRLFPLQFPVEHLAHITASPPKTDVILVVDHRILNGCESGVCFRGARGIVPES